MKPIRANPPDIVAGVPIPHDQSKFCFVRGFELPQSSSEPNIEIDFLTKLFGFWLPKRPS
ncbi:hypothetical protein PQQ86_25185 [Paraburkholderia sediminicola]|jgi:hypothetical protein|uniref:hypothetical protein n=1 Tax=Paraburkholderia sediminicola TaxID=458836 RepID=UPI0038BC1739